MKRSIVPVIVGSCVVLFLCCLCLSILIYVGIFSTLLFPETDTSQQVTADVPVSTPMIIQPTSIVGRVDESQVQVSDSTLKILENTSVPINDLLDLAQRLEGKENIPVALEPVSAPLQVGHQDSFWVTDTDIDENFKIEATLAYVTDHAYFWIENGIRYKEGDLRDLAETFENQIYPTNRALFGSEWSPGVDGDTHLYIIYANGLGSSLAGYYSSADEYHPLAHEYSNMHETFMLNADNLELDEEYTYGVLAHEFQHMIHWYQDRNEATWINEGLSELAAFINGYDIGGFDYLYAQEPDLQLNDWPNESQDTAPHYGASFLFIAYFLDRFGTPAIQELVVQPANGMASVDAVLEDLNIDNDLTGKPLQADDVFLDWVLATYLRAEQIYDGRYSYQTYQDAPQPDDTDTIRSCPTEILNRDVHQFGVDYIRINCRGDYTLRFEGSVDVGVLPVSPFSGAYALWSNRGDDSDMTMTKTFDFREHSGPLTLTYWTWYDIEEDYDYLYLTGSMDGKAWQILTTPSGTGTDPSGNSFGWGYSGYSGGDGRWIREEVDISQYAGKQVDIRFEYVTDGAVYGDGFLIDDIAIPEIGYFTDFELDADDWGLNGFVRIENSLPQTFRLALIQRGETTQVAYVDLDADNVIEIPLLIEAPGNDVVLVVTGTTRYTRQKALYHIQIRP